MPIYEFLCKKCKIVFEEMHLSGNDFGSVRCPECDGDNVEKQMSSFSASVSSGDPSSCNSFSPTCGAASGACGSGFCGNS